MPFSSTQPFSHKTVASAVVPFVVLVWLLSSLQAVAQSEVTIRGLPYITNYDTDTYKSGIQNWDIVQNEEGLIFVANNLGLLEYDGTDWTQHGIRSNTKVRSIFIGKDQRVYIGRQADFGYFYPNTQGQLSYHSLADSLPAQFRDFDEAWKIYGIDDKIYFCTFENIYELAEGQLNTITSDYRLEISFQVDNQLFIQEWENGLSRLENGRIELIPGGEFFKDKRISNVLNYDRESLMVTTFNDGIFLYNRGKVTPFNMGSFWQNEYLINHARRLRDGHIALGTQNAGLFVIDKMGREVIHLDKESGLVDNTVNFIFEDIQNSLWLALNNGLSRVDLLSPFTQIDTKMTLSGSGYAALQTNQGIYLGTNNGLYYHHNGVMSNVPGTAGQVYAVQEINGKILMGHNNGAFVIEGNNVRQINDEKGAWIFKTVPDRPDLLLVGTYQGLNLMEWDGNRLKFKWKIEGFDESSRVMEFEGDQLWIAQGYKGVFKLSFDEDLRRVTEAKLYNSNSGFPSNVLINVFDISNRMVFSSERGFYQYDESADNFVPYNLFNELIGANASIVDMETDEVGNIYFIASSHLGVLRKKGAQRYELHSGPFNKIQSLWNDDLGNVTVLDNQNILFGGKQGFIHYDPIKDIIRETPFNVLFRKVVNHGKTDSLLNNGHFLFEGKLTGKTQAPSAVPVFPFSQNSMSFDYAAVHFESNGSMLYQYKLNNYDNEWSEWTSNTSKEYTNLREGKYRFSVKAKNIFDYETEEIHYNFEIDPPIYRTVFAYGFYTLGSLALLFMGFKTLDRRYKKETQELTDKTNQALQEKDSEIETLAQQSAEQIMKLRNDKLRAEINLKSQSLTSSAMNLIQKNQLLNQIKNTLKTIAKEEASKTVGTKLTRIIRSIDKDLATGEEWEQFELNFDQVHGNFITRLKDKYPNLTPQELKFSAYIRMNLNTKEIANLLNISVRGVEIGRYRVRKKLELERKDNLSDFLLRF